MMRRDMQRKRTFDQVVGTFIGAIVMGIVRLVIAGAMGLNFVLYSNTVMASTIVGAMVIPVVGIVFFSVLKKGLGKDPKLVLGLRVGILAAAITGFIITIFGMSYFLMEDGSIYSYTPFDAFVRDLIGLMEAGDITTSMLYLVDDIFVIIILAISIQSIILASKSMPRGFKGTAPVQTQPPTPLSAHEMVPASTGNTCTTCGAIKTIQNQKFCDMCGTAFSPVTVVQPAVSTEVSAPASVSLMPPEPSVTPEPTVMPAPTVTLAAVTPTPSPIPPAATGSRPLQATKVDWTKVKDALKRAELKLEDVAGKAYQRLFKKTPTQRTTQICIGVIALVIVTFIILGASLGSLTPARSLSGTWKTSGTVKFNVEIDGVPSGYELRTMTWVISQLADPNQVLIEVSFTIEDHVTDPTYVHYISPIDLYGTISSSQLILRWGGSLFPRDFGVFSFTTSIITGTWDDTYSGHHEYTSTNGLTLTKQ